MLELKKINKSYVTGQFKQHALKNVSLKFLKNEFVAILGPSGSGKTTLLNIIGGLDRYDSGALIINNKSTKKFKNHDWDAYRNNSIGFIFQSYNLIPHISILANVEIGMTLSGISHKKRRKQALEVLKKVGLSEHIHKKPNQLSGGQMQRVAIARAIANNPDIILADEPTGALDTKTSTQIMNLIKDIAKDKLVIMVTHNPELAKNYASRIISMKDGEVIEDSKPNDKLVDSKENYRLRKTSMSFLTALKLSLNNIKTKKGRTILTAFASSIGIIGIALILSLSNGFDKQIDLFERNTLSSLPILISEQSMNLDEETINDLQKEANNKEDNYQDIDYVIPKKNAIDMVVHKNNITDEFVEYLKKADATTISGISYRYYTNLNLLNKLDDNVSLIDISNINFGSLPETLDGNNKTLISERYDILAGKEALAYDELMLIVDSKNHLDANIAKILNLSEEDNIAFTDILNSEIKLVLNDDYYQKHGNYYSIDPDLDSIYNKGITLKIVGIARLKEDYPDYLSESSLNYTKALLEYVIAQNSNSSIVKKQETVNYNVLTGEVYNLEDENSKATYDMTLAYLGAKSTPYMISIFPKDFDAKEAIINYLDDYNNNKSLEDKIVYTDQAEIMSSLSSNIMNAISIVLIAFSGISLVVSSIMIGIIMYISVLERTKEIGILRSLGARSKDISRVFNAETFIIGITSGIIGIIITIILLMPINVLLYNLTDLDNVAVLNPLHALILVTISVILTLIGGFIPAKIASKKDPVIALRTE